MALKSHGANFLELFIKNWPLGIKEFTIFFIYSDKIFYIFSFAPFRKMSFVFLFEVIELG